jgi:hypothetical protein
MATSEAMKRAKAKYYETNKETSQRKDMNIIEYITQSV